MWAKAILFSIAILLTAMWHGRYWFSAGYRREGWVFLGWMGIAWLTGLLFLFDFRLPNPTHPLFSNWK